MNYRSPSFRRVILAVVALLVLLLTALWLRLPEPAAGAASVQSTAREIIANPVKFATNRFTGGVGLALTIDPAGVLQVNGVLPGSPAEEAGLQKGDILLEIDGASTTNRPLTDIVASIRGFTIGTVNLLVQRNGTNFQSRLGRASWQELQITQ